MHYYGLDWVMLACGLAGNFLMVRKNRWTFALTIVSCLCGLFVASVAQQWGLVVFNVILIGNSVYGFVAWSVEEGKLVLPDVRGWFLSYLPRLMATPVSFCLAVCRIFA